jgi:hypothetical protein
VVADLRGLRVIQEQQENVVDALGINGSVFFSSQSIED